MMNGCGGEGSSHTSELRTGTSSLLRVSIGGGEDRSYLLPPSSLSAILSMRGRVRVCMYLAGTFFKQGHVVRNWKERLFRVFPDRIQYEVPPNDPSVWTSSPTALGVFVASYPRRALSPFPP